MSDRLSIIEDKKMKRRIEESPSVDINLELTLKLGSNVLVYESSSNSDEYGDSGVAPSPAEISNDDEEIEPEEFPCKLCDKKFYSVNALNGHQNAHRRERDPPKMENENDVTASEHRARVHPYSAMVNHLPFHGSPIYHGVHIQPVAQMSPMPWGHFGPIYGNLGLHRRSLLGPQFEMASNSLDESAEIPILNPGNVVFGYEFNQYPSLPVDEANRATTTTAHANLGGLQQNRYTRN